MNFYDRFENPLSEFDTSFAWEPDPTIRSDFCWPYSPGVLRLLRRAHIAARRRVFGWGEFAFEHSSEELAERLRPKLLIPPPTFDIGTVCISVDPSHEERRGGLTGNICRITGQGAFLEPLFVPPFARSSEIEASLIYDQLSVVINKPQVSQVTARQTGEIWIEEMEATMRAMVLDHEEFSNRLDPVIDDAIQVGLDWFLTRMWGVRRQAKS